MTNKKSSSFHARRDDCLCTGLDGLIGPPSELLESVLEIILSLKKFWILVWRVSIVSATDTASHSLLREPGLHVLL